MQRKQTDEIARAQERAARAEAQTAEAQAAALTAQTQAAAAQALLERERAAKQAAITQVQAAAVQPVPQTVVQTRPAQDTGELRKKELRRQLLERFNASLTARDTPRGLTVILPAADFQGTRVNPAIYERLARVAAVLRTYPDLTIEVDGHETMSFERAHAVRDALIADGLPSNTVIARGLGDSRPLASNATPTGREQNTRVEIVVSGNPIGNMPYWAQTYTLTPRH